LTIDCQGSKGANVSQRIDLLSAYEVLHYFQCVHITSMLEGILDKFIKTLFTTGLIQLVNLCADYKLTKLHEAVLARMDEKRAWFTDVNELKSMNVNSLAQFTSRVLSSK
jgi:hypothetical protein